MTAARIFAPKPKFGISWLSSRYRLSPRETLWCCAIILAFALINAAFLARATWTYSWIQDHSGKVIPADFVSFWSTSRMLQIAPAHQVYDWALHHAAEIEVLGPGYDGRFPWLNPPIFLLFVAPLALLPYSLAFLSWIVVTFTAYGAALGTIFPGARKRWIWISAFAFPATIATTIVGQNGFLTAALLAGALGLLERRPVLAGCLLGRLTCKPQFGLLFPIVLVADRRWQALGAAVATTILLLAATTATYGLDAWVAFWDSLDKTREAILVQGQMGFHKLHSIYGLILWSTGNATAAWTAQALVAVAAAASVLWVWRKQVPEDVKAAALGVGVLLMTPYALIYDFVILSVPIAFMIRAGLARGFGSLELPLMALACLLILAFPLVRMPIGPLAEMMIAFAIMQRVILEERGSSALPHAFSGQAG